MLKSDATFDVAEGFLLALIVTTTDKTAALFIRYLRAKTLLVLCKDLHSNFEKYMVLTKLKLSSRDLALTAIFAALSAIVVRVVPGIPIIGLSSASIKFDAALAPIYGMIIGPYLGFLAGLVGGLVVASSLFSILTSFATAISAFVAGSAVKDMLHIGNKTIKGWKIATAAVGLLILGWYATWVGQEAPFYPILHLAGFFVLLLGRGRIAKAFEKGEGSDRNWRPDLYFMLIGVFILPLGFVFSSLSSNLVLSSVAYSVSGVFMLALYIIGGVVIVYGILGSRVKENYVIAVALGSYCGIIADHMVGNLVFIQLIDAGVLKVPPEILPPLFMGVLPISAVERLLFTTIATVVGVGLISSIRRAGLYWKRE